MKEDIISELRAAVGPKNVLTEEGELFMYSFDSALDRGIPSVVIIPRSSDQVSRVVGILSKNRIPFVARGAATSLCGGPVPLQQAAVISLAYLKKTGKVDPLARELNVEPGVVNLRLQEKLAPYGLFYPPDPGSQKACTIGGNVGTNAGGPHCLKYGVTSQYVEGLTVVMPDGRVQRFHISDPGYDMVGLMVGSEGTLGIVTNIRIRVLRKPPVVKTMLVSFPSIESAIQSVTDIIAAGILPATLEAMDHTVVAAVEAFVQAGYPLDAEAVLLIEVDGEKVNELDEQVERINSICQKNGHMEFRFAKTEEERQKLWEGRRGSYPAMARLAPNVLVEDGAVPRTKLPQALAKIKEIADEHDIQVALLFHAGDGNLHPQILFDERDEEQTKIVKEAGHKMLKACVDLGGTISGEHGIGVDKREAMKWLFTRETLSLFRRIKNCFDPENLCNPEKLIPLVGKSIPQVEKKSEGESILSPHSKPTTEDELKKVVIGFRNAKRPWAVQGLKSKIRIKETNMISMTEFNKVLDLDRGNLTLTVQAGVPIQSLVDEVERAGLYLWLAGTGTVGGVVATRESFAPPLRDIILGMRVMLPTGEVVQFGAKTMKNVAGYDAAKLLIGSWGTLGIILDVTFRLFPKPALEQKIEKVKPFVFQPIHKLIKGAFDPAGLMAQKHLNLGAEELSTILSQPVQHREDEDDILGKMGDKFWGAS